MSHANRGKGIVSITVRYPFPVQPEYIWVYIMFGLALESANVELRFKRVGSQRRTSAIRGHIAAEMQKRFVNAWTRMATTALSRDRRVDDLISHRAERTCHLDIITPPCHNIRVPFNNATCKSVSVDGTYLNRSFQGTS